MTLRSVEVHGCTASSVSGQPFGGGVEVDGGTLEMVGGSVSNCTASSESDSAVGGGVQVDGGTVTLRSVEVHGCTASSVSSQSAGGGVGVNGGTLDMVGGSVSNCTASSPSNTANGGGLATQGSAYVAVLQSVTLRANAATTGTALYLGPFASGSTLLSAAVLRIEPDCDVHAAGALIHSVDAQTPLALRGLHVEPCAAAAPPSIAATLLTCAERFDSSAYGERDPCGFGAACTDAPIAAGSPLTSPGCACVGDATVSPAAADAVVAPYLRTPGSGGCIYPLVAANLTQVAKEATLTLTRSTFAPKASVELSLTVGGTAWELPGASRAYNWSVASVGAPWLSLPNASGLVPAPAIVNAASSTVAVLADVSSAQLADAIEPYTCTLSLSVALPGRDLLPAPPQLVVLPVSVYVRAEPVAGRATLVDAGVLVATVGVPAPFRFQARDFEGRPLARVAGHYSATCGAGCEAEVAYAGSGAYAVNVVLSRVGEYAVALRLAGGAVDGALPFRKRVHSACPLGKYSAFAIGQRQCLDCPAGTACERGDHRGATLPTLALLPNHWRLSPNTSDIRSCRVRPSAGGTNATPCTGGVGPAPDYCHTNLTGPLCRSCLVGGEYFDGATARCHACAYTGAAVAVVPALVALSCVAAIWLLVQLNWRSSGLPAAPAAVCLWWQRTRSLAPRLGLLAKAKLCVAYYQVVTAMPEVFDVPLPPQYYDAMRVFNVLSFDWLNIGAPAACLGGFRSRLLVEAWLPVLVLVVLGVASVLAAVAMGARSEQRGGAVAIVRSGGLTALPWALVALFAFVPSVSTRIFSAFACQGFGYDDATGAEHLYLHADLAIRCAGDAYRTLTSEATGLILLWPVGVPVLFLALLRIARPAIVQRLPSALSVAVSFLHAEYEPELFFWELLELFRKLFLTGFVLLVPHDYALLRLVIALLVSISFVVLLLHAAPYRERWTGYVAVATNVTLTFTLVAALLIKVHAELTPAHAVGLFGFASSFPLTVLILIFNFSVVGSLLLFVFGVGRQEYAVRRLRYGASGLEVVVAPLDQLCAHHLFLSHVSGRQPIARAAHRRPSPHIPSRAARCGRACDRQQPYTIRLWLRPCLPSPWGATWHRCGARGRTRCA